MTWLSNPAITTMSPLACSMAVSGLTLPLNTPITIPSVPKLGSRLPVRPPPAGAPNKGRYHRNLGHSPQPRIDPAHLTHPYLLALLRFDLLQVERLPVLKLAAEAGKSRQ
jgi:hypothetical protein